MINLKNGYGITSDEDIKGTSVGTLLKQGNALHDGTSVNFEVLLMSGAILLIVILYAFFFKRGKEAD